MGSAASGSAAAGSAAVADGSGAAAFKVGDAFWSLWNNGFAYRGQILAINEDGSYQVQWEGYGRNDHWDAKRAQREKPTENPVQVGERIWTAPELWEDDRARQGKVLRINKDATYRLSFYDTDDANVAKEYLQRDKPAPLPKKPAATSKPSSGKKAGVKECWEGSEYTRCDEYHCFNLHQDNDNCGACGRKCPKTANTCSNSECKCLSGSYDSDGNCH